MKEYEVKVTSPKSIIIVVKAKTDNEAIDKAKEKIANGDYDSSNPISWEEDTYEIISSKLINEISIKLEQVYLATNDCTIIWEYTYRGDEPIRERIVGYYHGLPDDDGLRQFAYKGVEGVIDDNHIFDNVKSYM